MKGRWSAAIVAAVAMGSMLMTGTSRSGGSGLSELVEAAGACEPNAKPANLAFAIKDMHGADVKLASYKGKVILLNFWATWCGPCKYEIPALVELQAKYKDKGLIVLGFSVDDPVDKLKPFANQYNMNYPVLVGLGRDDVQDAYGPIWGIPVTIFISRDARICRKRTGIASKEQFEKEILGLLQ